MGNLGQSATQITSELVRINSTTGTPGEVEALLWVARIFEANPGYTLSWARDERALVVAPTQHCGKELLLLSGHVDTVVATPDDWSFDPWCGDVVGGTLRGRGASDMKSGVGAQIAAMLEAGPTAPVALALSTREEWGCAGTPDVIEAIEKADIKVGAILVAEPTDGLLLLGHKGPLWLEVTVRGRSAHGSAPHLGENAISKAAALILRAESEMPLREHWRLGKETLNVGIIRGGAMRNVVPDTATIDVDIRTVDPDAQPVIDWWRSQPETADVRVVAHHPPVWTAASDPWVGELPLEPESAPAAFGTEAAPLGAALNWPPTVIWGPGPRAAMHVVDEAVPVSSIATAAEGYLHAIGSWDRQRSAYSPK